MAVLATKIDCALMQVSTVMNDGGTHLKDYSIKPLMWLEVCSLV